MKLFIFGTLQYAPLFLAVAGRAEPKTNTAQTPTFCTARLAGFHVGLAADLVLPMLLPLADSHAQGQLWSDLTAEQLERLHHYELPFGYDLREVQVQTDAGPEQAMAYFAPADQEATDQAWDLQHWAGLYGARAEMIAKEQFSHQPRLSAEQVRQQWWMMAIRAESSLRARNTPSPATRRFGPTPADYGLESARPIEGHFFKLAQSNMEHRRFDGGRAKEVLREVLIGVDAALVLPYDAARGRVLLVEQFRSGPAQRGDLNPWTLEPVAGIIDPGETPEQAARREAKEEAGIVLGKLERLFSFYPSPGNSTDYYHCFVGQADLPHLQSWFGGLAEEEEDLRLHVLPLTGALALIETGEITAGPLITMLYKLERQLR
ncbi:MAG: NUDIX domain-containing protein [Rhodobacteraceae bacterium]|nr:NUDIX domain-containing protein [Paracoccaceae bacterium]